MTVKELIIKKVEHLPEKSLNEIADFIEFLNQKRKKNNSINISEQGMDEYLKNLETYENLLAKGKIKWN